MKRLWALIKKYSLEALEYPFTFVSTIALPVIWLIVLQRDDSAQTAVQTAAQAIPAAPPDVPYPVSFLDWAFKGVVIISFIVIGALLKIVYNNLKQDNASMREDHRMLEEKVEEIDKDLKSGGGWVSVEKYNELEIAKDMRRDSQLFTLEKNLKEFMELNFKLLHATVKEEILRSVKIAVKDNGKQTF